MAKIEAAEAYSGDDEYESSSAKKIIKPKFKKRNHGSTTFFLFLDYLFLLIFFLFLFFFLYKFFTH